MLPVCVCSALEFIAIRNDVADDADDRCEFEADTALALVRALAHGALTISGSGRAAAARVAVGPAGAPSAALIRDAAHLLGLVVDASDPANMPAAAGGSGAQPAAGGAGALTRTISSTGSGGISVSGLGTAPAHPTPAPAASSKHKKQPSGGKPAASGAAAGHQDSLTQPGSGLLGDSGLLSPSDSMGRPVALMPAVVTDHTSGLAVLRTWSCEWGWGAHCLQRGLLAWRLLPGTVAPSPHCKLST